MRTRNPSVAKERSGIAAAHIEKLFASLREGPTPLTHKQVVALSRRAYELLTRAEDEPGSSDIWETVGAVFSAAREGRAIPIDGPMPSREEASTWQRTKVSAAREIKAISKYPLDLARRPLVLEKFFGMVADRILGERALVIDADTRLRLLVALRVLQKDIHASSSRATAYLLLRVTSPSGRMRYAERSALCPTCC